MTSDHYYLCLREKRVMINVPSLATRAKEGTILYFIIFLPSRINTPLCGSVVSLRP